jgi:hypothetical protein
MHFEAGTVRDLPVEARHMCGLTWTGELLWFSDMELDQIIAVDPFTGAVQAKIACPGVRSGLTRLNGMLIQVVDQAERLKIINPEDGKVVDTLPNPRPGAELADIEATPAGLWMGYPDLGLLDLRGSGDLQPIGSIPAGPGISGVTATDRYVAFGQRQDSLITVLDPDQRKHVASVGVNGHPAGITWDGRMFWYCDVGSGQLRAIEVPGIVG